MSRLAALAAVAMLSGCLGSPAIRPPSSTIAAVGLIDGERESAGTLIFQLEGGRTWEARAGTYRWITNWGMKLLVAGTDASGIWVATFGPQQGLPQDCYFSPEVGTEWGDGIAIRGIFWPKAPSFVADPIPSVGSDYPIGTRFCLNPAGQIASMIPNTYRPSSER